MSPSRGLIIWNDRASLITGFRRETANLADLHPLLRDEGNEPRPNSRFSVFAFPPRFTVDSFVTSFAFKHGSMVSSFLTPPVSKRNQEFRTKLEIWRENCAGIFNCREIAILFSNTAIIYLTLLNNAISELQHISLFDQSIVFRSKVQFPTNSILERFYTLFITLQKYN